MIRSSLISVVVACGIYGCSGATVDIGSGEGGSDGGSTREDTGTNPDAGGGKPDGGGSTCTAPAPNCFGNDDSTCCGQDPSGPATCVGGDWMCGSAKAPGCNGTSCLHGDDGGVDSGPPDGGTDVSPTCTGTAPDCYGDSDKTCCPVPLHDPSGIAKCVGTTWMCGAAEAPGCDTHCGIIDSGPPPFDVITIDVGPPPPPPLDGFTPCGPKICISGDTCVVTTSTSGPCLKPGDAGACPPKYVLEGGCCVFATTTYDCDTTPPLCGGAPTCGCASSLCGLGCTCSGSSGDDLDCLCAGL
jgi:hypothetical protein